MLTALLLGLAQPLPEIIRRRPDVPKEAAAAEPAAEAPEANDPSPPPEPDPVPKPVPRASLIGEWSLGLSRRGTRCAISLSNHPWGQGLSTASIGSNCPPNLFAVSRWRLTGAELQLTDRTGRSMARLAQTDKAWLGETTNGDGIIMERRH